MVHWCQTGHGVGIRYSPQHRLRQTVPNLPRGQPLDHLRLCAPGLLAGVSLLAASHPAEENLYAYAARLTAHRTQHVSWHVSPRALTSSSARHSGIVEPGRMWAWTVDE